MWIRTIFDKRPYIAVMTNMCTQNTDPPLTTIFVHREDNLLSLFGWTSFCHQTAFLFIAGKIKLNSDRIIGFS